MSKNNISFGSHVRILADDDPRQELSPEESFDRGVVGQVRFLIAFDSRDVPRPYCVGKTLLGGPTVVWVHSVEEVDEAARENSLDWTEFNEVLTHYRKRSRSAATSQWEQECSTKLLGRIIDARDALIWRGYVPMSLAQSDFEQRFLMATTPSEFAKFWRGGWRP
jgi:hypothetical protein